MDKERLQLELNLARDMQNNKKDFFRYIGQQRKMKETVPALMSEERYNCTDWEKAEVLNNIFSSVFTDKNSSHAAQLTESKGRDWENEVLLIVGEDQVQDHPRNLNVHKPV